MPAGATTGPISVTGNSTTYTTSSNFTVTEHQAGDHRLRPDQYGVRGATVTINGANFTNLATPAVEFNGVAATNQTPTSTTALIATVPAGATTGLITVNNTSGTGTGPALFYLQPWITGMSATSGVVNSTLLLTGPQPDQCLVGHRQWRQLYLYQFADANRRDRSDQRHDRVDRGHDAGRDIHQHQCICDFAQNLQLQPTFGPAGTIVTINGTSLFDVTSVEFGGGERHSDFRLHQPGAGRRPRQCRQRPGHRRHAVRQRCQLKRFYGDEVQPGIVDKNRLSGVDRHWRQMSPTRWWSQTKGRR